MADHACLNRTIKSTSVPDQKTPNPGATPSRYCTPILMVQYELDEDFSAFREIGMRHEALPMGAGLAQGGMDDDSCERSGAGVDTLKKISLKARTPPKKANRILEWQESRIRVQGAGNLRCTQRPQNPCPYTVPFPPERAHINHRFQERPEDDCSSNSHRVTKKNETV